MARPRRPVQTLQEAIQVQPVASPVQVNPTAAPVHLPIYDFAPISETITGYLKQQADENAKVKEQAGEAWATQRPDLVKKMQADAAAISDEKARAEKIKTDFDWLQKKGLIPAAADPYFQIGATRATARLVVGAYRDAVLARANEVATLTGTNGMPVQPADPEQVLNEEWNKVADSPALQNFYGSKEAMAVKSQVDEEFRTKAGLQKAAAVEKNYRDGLTRDIGSQFDRILAANPAVTGKELQPLTDFLTTEVRGHNVQEPRQLVLDALELSFQRQAAVSPDEAVRAVYAAQDLVVGNVRLGNDRSGVGQRLADLTLRYLAMAHAEDGRAVEQNENKRRLAIQKGEAEYVPLLIQAKQKGLSIQQIAAQVSDRFLQEDAQGAKFEGYGAFVVDSLQDYARHLDSTRQSDQSVTQQFQVLISDGRLDDADALARSALKSGQLTGEDYHTYMDQLEARRSVSQFVENNGTYNAVRAQYNEVKPSGFAPEIQQGIDDQVTARQRALDQDVVAFVRTTAGKPNREELHRNWLNERSAADLTAIRQMGLDIRKRRDELERDVRQRMTRYQDAGELIDRGEKTGAFTTLDAQALREANIKTGVEREQFFNTPEYKAAEGEIEQAVFDANGKGAESTNLRNAALQRLRDQYDVGLTKVLADPSADPRTFPALARGALHEAHSAIMDQLFPGSRAQIESGVKAGKSQPEISAALVVQQQDQTRAQTFAKILSSPQAREHLSPAAFEQHPAVTPDFYKYAAAWQSGVDPFFGSPVKREDVEALGKDSAEKIMGDQTLTDQERRDAIGSIATVVGVSPQDVLQDRFTIARTDYDVLKAAQGVKTLDIWLRTPHDVGQQQRFLAQRAALAEIAKGQPTVVDMKGYTWRPWSTPFFRSRDAFKAFTEDPDWETFLTKIGIDPKDELQVEQFAITQLDAIERTNP